MEPDEITARIDEQIQQAQQHAAQMQLWAEEVDRLTAEGTALRGGVRVAVNNAGVLTSVRVTDQACEAGGPALASGIMAAVKAAQQIVADELGRSAARRFGREAELTQRMVEDVSARMGVSVNLEEPRPGAAQGVIR